MKNVSAFLYHHSLGHTVTTPTILMHTQPLTHTVCHIYVSVMHTGIGTLKSGLHVDAIEY